jgi:hypothetical protein
MQVTDVRSAIEQQRKNTPCHDNTPSPAVPCFLFGMHDAYCNPLGRIDEAIFNRTGMNLPLWVPTRAASTCDNLMAFGEAVDPACFTAHTCSCARGGQRERMRTGPGRRKEYQLGFPHIIASVVGPTFALISGAMIYIVVLEQSGKID